MTPTLADLQQTFAQALQYQASGDRCHISSDKFTADEYIQIYRNNFIIGLSDVLQTTYPMVHALVGEECFAQLARHHILECPLNSGDVSHYGEHFSTSIAKFTKVIEAVPYIQDVACFEWQVDASAQTLAQTDPDKHSQPIAQLANLTAKQQANVRLQLSPSALTFQSQYAVFSLRLAISANNFTQLNINQAEQGIIISQYDGQCWTMGLDKTSFELVEYLRTGHTLERIPQTHLAYLEALLENQLISGFTLAPY
ncbi:DNA-binding domain-containing protein [Vibrio pectenicida]|uniref:HvfC/BufC N-terminal domain-containing protein n=1 Tax=Vibrio pectenicida TaxID=62763 RepID=UPI003B9A9C75